jgi:hypothetical protein
MVHPAGLKMIISGPLYLIFTQALFSLYIDALGLLQ